MTYPSSDVNTTNADASTDSPAIFRTDVLDLITKFNLLRNHISTFVQGLLTSVDAAAARTTLGTVPRATRINVASVAGTVDLTTTAPNTDDIQITGALAITGFTVAVGRVFRVTAGGAFTLINGASLVTQTGANIVAVAGDTFMLRATASNVMEVLNYVSPVGAVLVTGNQTIAGIKTFSSQPVLPQKITLDAAKALSGSSSTFTGIPSWVNRITVSFIGVSTNGIINIYLQLGSTAGGIAATGYGGSTATLVNAGAVSVVTPTTYAAIGTYGVASASFSGQAVISRISSTAWAIASNVGHYANSAISTGAYAVDIGNVLDRIQLSTSDTFDAGSWNILYE